MSKTNIEENPTVMPEIDIKNLQASLAATGDTAFANAVISTAKTNKRKEAKKKFNFLEPVQFKLPSGGKFYQDSDDEDLKKGYINIIPMSTAEEEILTDKSYTQKGSTFRIIFDTCLETSYPAKRLLSYDAAYLMYALRQITYGTDYNFTITCDCGKDIDYTMNISDIDFPELTQEKDVRVIKLPVSKYEVTIRLLRLGDEEEITRLQNEDEDANPTALNYAVRTLSIKDNKGNELSPDDWIEFYSCFPAADRREISKSFEGASMDPKVNMVCPKCNKKITMSVPMSEDFFRIY